tara:strand:+ start:9843 stop:10976 length:1134 start_codon:yes stop_codon:yes gene_type:complete
MDIPLSVPNLRGKELEYVTDCINSEWISSEGSYVEKFSEAIKNYTKAKFAIPCINGTSALQTSLRLIDLKPNEEVIVPSLTFIAPVNAIRYFHANPIFFDCDSSFNIDINKLYEFLKKNTFFDNGDLYNNITQKKIKAIIPVNIFGNTYDIDSLLEVSNRFNLPVIEDASEAIGSFYTKNRHAGTAGLTGCLSFNGNKMITTGGGGMILTNNKKLAEKASYLTRQAKNDKVFYVHNEVGYNFRLTNVAAAIGLAQLEQLESFLIKKKENFNIYKELINKKQNIELMNIPKFGKSNYWFYALKINSSYKRNIKEIIDYLGKNNVQARPVWKLNHEQLPFKNCFHGDLSQSIELYNTVFNVPCSTNLKTKEIEFVCSLL